LRLCLTAILVLLAAPVAARELVLELPLDCTLGKTCFIQQYTDSDPGLGAADHTCGPLSYDGHKGTDFALPSLAAVTTGVDVFPAAPGIVAAVRDGLADQLQNTENPPDITDKECGNGVVVNHGGGWETQYCHLKRRSVTVRKGQSVGIDTVIGQVGLSGATEFPHLHLSVRRDGKVVDPFNAAGTSGCDAAAGQSLWKTPPEYRPGGLISAGFAAAVPTFDSVRAGTAGVVTLPDTAPALVIWGFAFGGMKGDSVILEIIGPDGIPDGMIVSQAATLEKSQAQFFRAVGRRAPPEGWPKGRYQGQITLIRGGAEMESRTADVVILSHSNNLR